jgi:Zn-dependent M28 family amino/carboxypeptidase
VPRGSQTTHNVIGILEGSDPVLRGEAVVVGAHLDHLGAAGSSYYPGADDNASGTAALMELAEAFAALRGQLGRTIVFVAFSGEELGLVGSRHYVEAPTLPLSSTRFMLNLDMVGHLDTVSGGTLIAYNVTASPGLVAFVNDIASRYRSFRTDLRGASGGSDHAPFAARGIPVVFLHTGLTDTYHKATDTPETLNYSGLAAATAFGLELAWRASYSTDLSRLGSSGVNLPRTFDLDHDTGPFLWPER